MKEPTAKSRIVGLTRYGRAYRGFLEMETGYLFFQFSRGRLQVLQRYSKADFPDYPRFVNLMSKFMPVGRLLSRPLEISGLSEAQLARAYKRIHTGEARLLDRPAWKIL